MADSPAAVATDPSAPAAERHDAEVEFRKSSGTAGLAAELMPSAELEPVISRIQEVLFEQDLNKAARGNLIQGPWKKRPAQDGGQSVFLDDFQIQTQGPYWDRPGILGRLGHYEILEIIGKGGFGKGSDRGDRGDRTDRGDSKGKGSDRADGSDRGDMRGKKGKR